jgi:hypothetical protein
MRLVRPGCPIGSMGDCCRALTPPSKATPAAKQIRERAARAAFRDKKRRVSVDRQASALTQREKSDT